MANPKLAGTLFLSANGVSYPIVSDPEWTVSDVVRASLVGMDGYHGHSETPNAPHMACVIRDTGATPMSTFRDMVDVPVVFQLANGKVVTGTNMVTTEAIVVNSTDATARIRWEGPTVLETLP